MIHLIDSIIELARPLSPVVLVAVIAAGVSFLSVVVFSVFKWIIWLLISFIMAMLQVTYGAYQGSCIFIDLVVLSTIKSIMWIYKQLQSLSFASSTALDESRRLLWQAQTYREWSSRAAEIDRLAGTADDWKNSDDGFPMGAKLRACVVELRRARQSGDYKTLLFHLPGYIKRNHLGMDDIGLFSGSFTSTKTAVNEYVEEIKNCFSYLRQIPETIFPIGEKIGFFGKLSRNLGQTALCLSGGGSLSMYHMGVMRALIESGNYSKIQVISGTSGGSICAAMCACKTEQELLDEVLVNWISTDYRRNGVMKKENIAWFPPLWKQMLHFMTTGLLIDNKEYCRTCEYYWGDTTFEEGYQATKKHVCITVTASAGGSSAGPNKLLLNHISTPHVLIRSAVAASCALPGIMASNKLLCKGRDGVVVPFEVDGDNWVDGSFEADVPFKRMSTLFSVSNFIVSQVNFHVVPFLQHKLPGNLGQASCHSPGTVVSHSVLKTLMKYLDMDLKHRALTLAGMGLLPRWYGQDMTKLLKQNYRGDVTIVPELKIDESMGIKAVMNPTVQDMIVYLRDGRRACWPHLVRIKHLLAVESCLHEQLESLLEDAHDLKRVGINTAFDLNTNHGIVGMGLGLGGGSWGHFATEEKLEATSDEDSSTSRGQGVQRRKKDTVVQTSSSGGTERGGRPRLRSASAPFDIEHQASVSDFLIFQRRKQEIVADDMTDGEIRQKILDLENEILSYKSALTKRQEVDSMFTSFYY